MKISKRQLKRIIREEYSKLRRRGLIREMHHDTSHQPIQFDRSDPIACAEYDVFDSNYGGSVPHNCTPQWRKDYDDAFEEIEADYEEQLIQQEPRSYEYSGRGDYDYDEPYYDSSWGDSPKDYID